VNERDELKAAIGHQYEFTPV